VSGKVVHFEIPADDVARAQHFYGEAFGWQLNEMPEMGYTLVMTTPSGDSGPLEPGAINGGMMKRQGHFTAPVITIEVDDIDEALTQVEKLGGKTATGKQSVGDMGFTGYFHDTEGNLIGLWQSASPA
jgi:predicted enzyme related to lactoylglutathione lyase